MELNNVPMVASDGTKGLQDSDYLALVLEFRVHADDADMLH